MLLIGGSNQPGSFSAKLRWVGGVCSWHCSPFRALFSVLNSPQNRCKSTFELEDPDEAGKPKAPLWTFSLLYSVDTFVPFVTVSNIKEWGWKIADDWRWWELLEQILGFFLFSAAAYSLGSYIL
jgi:hypothetical protein